jgi:hypothetical protein
LQIFYLFIKDPAISFGTVAAASRQIFRHGDRGFPPYLLAWQP